jgi:hypothetical protein
VSDDNPFSEALFRTCKYRPDYPVAGFESLQAARQWVLRFVHWYNHEHRHSALRFLTPHQRHSGQEQALLAERAALYRQARARHPRRWSGAVRNWTPIGAVTLNAPPQTHTQREAACVRRGRALRLTQRAWPTRMVTHDLGGRGRQGGVPT